MPGAGALPTVYRATTTIYASMSSPVHMAFGSDGTMYVGNAGTSVQIYRVGQGGSPVQTFGLTPTYDPDAVAVDRTGAITGVPGAVLVAGYDSAGKGYLKGIMPNGLVFDVFVGMTTFPNISSFTYDRSGNLLAVDGNGNWGGVTASTITKLGSVPVTAYEIVADATNRIWLSTTADSQLRVFSAAGTFLNYASVGAKAGSPLAASSSSFWGTNIYAVGADGSLLSIDLVGNVQTNGTGFQNAHCMTFGADGSLYLSEIANNRIIKITPDGGPTVGIHFHFSYVDICWNSLTNHIYQPQYRSDLTTNIWVNLGGTLPGNNAIMCVTDAIHPNENRFYRVQESP